MAKARKQARPRRARRPSPRGNPPSVEKAVKLLERLVDAARAAGGARLPTVAYLARTYHFSNTTLCRALAQLEARGDIEQRRKAGIVVRSLTPPARARPDKPSYQPTKQERVYRMLRKEFAFRHHEAGHALPSSKQLAARLGIGRDTLRGVMRRLAEEGAIERHGRWFRFPPMERYPGTGAIMLVAHGFYYGISHRIPERAREWIQLMDLYCCQHNVTLDIVPFPLLAEHMSTPGSVRRFIDRELRGRKLLGIQVWSIGMRMDQLRAAIENLAFTKAPLAVFDEEGKVPETLMQRSGRTNVKFFSIETNKTSGIHMGRFLKRTGHPTVLYITPYANTGWSRTRLQGMREAVDGSGCAVVPLTASHEKSFKVDEDPRMQTMLTAMRRATRDFETSPMMQNKHLNVVAHIEDYMRYRGVWNTLIPVFERALAMPGTTMWVGTNDFVASLAHGFLSNRGIRIPEDISLAGFDNSHIATFLKLTSYDFNAPRILQAMLTFNLEGGRSTNPYLRGTLVEIDGYVNNRWSVRMHSGSSRRHRLSPP